MSSKSSDSLEGDDLLSADNTEKTTDNVESSEYSEEDDDSTAQKSSDNEDKDVKNRKEQQEDMGDSHEKEKSVSDANEEEDIGEINEKDDWSGKSNGTEDGSGETKKKLNPFLSDRLEYISRPKKDFLDNIVDTRLDGSLPENSYPSWKIIPLPNKLPFDNCPIPVTKRKMGTNLFLPPPANTFDLEDENNLLLPSKTYENLHDPYLKEYIRKEHVLEQIKNKQHITESGRTVCKLDDINRYRRYQRRILAAKARKMIRDQDEAVKKEHEKVLRKQIKRDAEKYEAKRTQGMLRRWIKETVSSIKDSSLDKQIDRDKKVLNAHIGRQKAQKDRAERVAERTGPLFANYIKQKYEDAEGQRKRAQLEHVKKDLERLEKLCRKQEEKEKQRKKKLEDFWKRKSDWQKEWLETGKRLEREQLEEKKKNIEIHKETRRLPIIFLKEKEGSTDQLKGKVKERKHMKAPEKKYAVPSCDEIQQKKVPVSQKKVDTSQEKETEGASATTPIDTSAESSRKIFDDRSESSNITDIQGNKETEASPSKTSQQIEIGEKDSLSSETPEQIDVEEEETSSPETSDEADTEKSVPSTPETTEDIDIEEDTLSPSEEENIPDDTSDDSTLKP